MQAKFRTLLWQLWLPCVILIVWEFAAGAGWISPLFFPPPSHIGSLLVRSVRTGELIVQLAATMQRTLTGAAIGIIAGTIFGLLMGVCLPVQKSTESLLSVLISTPKVSLLPILMLVLGIGEAPRLTLIATAAFVVVALQMIDAMRTLDAGYRELATNYGAGLWQLIRCVYIPAAVPHLFTGIRLAIGRALGTCITVEILGARHGIGHMIWSGWESFQPDRIYAGVFLTAALGVLFHLSLKAIERRAAPWRA